MVMMTKYLSIKSNVATIAKSLPKTKSPSEKGSLTPKQKADIQGIPAVGAKVKVTQAQVDELETRIL